MHTNVAEIQALTEPSKKAGGWKTLWKRGQQTPLLLTVFFVNLFVILGATAYLWNSHQSLESRAATDAETLTRLSAKNIEGQIARFDLAMRMVESEIKEGGGVRKAPEPASMQLFNAEDPVGVPGTGPAMRTEDADGVILAGPGFEKSKLASVATRDYFLKLKSDPKLSFAVGESVLGKLSKKWIVPFARPVRGPDGSFAGLVTVSVPVELFQPQSVLSIHKDTLFLVLDTQKRVISRFTKGEAQTNDFGKVLNGPIAQRATYTAETFLPGSHYKSGIDGIERVVAIQKLQAAPWVLAVGVPWDSYVSVWSREVQSTALLVLVFLAVSTILAIYLNKGIAQQQKDLHHIEFLAYHDVLKELPNRKLLKDRFAQAVNHAVREHKKVALLYLDLDHFKSVNDSLGHVTGDALLKETALRLNACVRGSDTVSRQGGDEFLLLLPDLDSAQAVMPVVSKVMQSLSLPILVDRNELHTSTSVGIAIFPDDGQDFDTLQKQADVAMYKAKEQGRSCYCFFNEAMNTSARERLEMTNALKRAIDRKEFILHYQPQIDLETNDVVGVEALVRWNHPQFGMVPPGRFIPLAEQTGLIIPLGTWVLEEACRQAVEWQRSGLPPFTMAVNLSAVQFKRGDIEGTVARVLAESGLPAHMLELELTESILMNDTQEVLASVKRLKAQGVQLSVDDFGTGYSSLCYLKSFKVDKLKIDQSFTRGLTSNTEDHAIITAIIQLARTLKFRTIAEGVETKEELQMLTAMGCNEVQGYHFARPMPAIMVVDFLQTQLAAKPSLRVLERLAA